MQKFTFRSNNGQQVIVEAMGEDWARAKAMKALWGGPLFYVSGMDEPIPYEGAGLYLLNVE